MEERARKCLHIEAVIGEPVGQLLVQFRSRATIAPVPQDRLRVAFFGELAQNYVGIASRQNERRAELV